MSELNSIECNSAEKTCYQKNSKVILNRAKHYYKNDKERSREQARDQKKYQKNIKKNYHDTKKFK